MRPVSRIVVFVGLLFMQIESDAFADVKGPIVEHRVNSIAEILGIRSEATGKRLLVMNGVPIRAEVIHSDVSAERALASYLVRMNGQMPAKRDVGSSETVAEDAPKSDAETFWSRMNTPQSISGKGWSALLLPNFDEYRPDSGNPNVVRGSGAGAASKFILGFDRPNKRSAIWELEFASMKDTIEMFTGMGRGRMLDSFQPITLPPGASVRLSLSEYFGAREFHALVLVGGTRSAISRSRQLLTELDKDSDSIRDEQFLGADAYMSTAQQPGQVIHVLSSDYQGDARFPTDVIYIRRSSTIGAE